MSVRGRSYAGTISPTGSGGSIPTIGNFKVGPYWGGVDGDEYTVNVTTSMTNVALESSKNVGVQTTMTQIALGTSKTIGVHVSGSVIGAPFYQSVATLDETASATSHVVGKPTGLAVGDLMMATVMHLSGSATFTPPSGFTLIARTVSASILLPAALETFWKIADSGDVAASNFTFTSSASIRSAIAIHRLNGIDPSPIHVTAAAIGSASNPVCPSVTTTVANCLVMVICSQQNTLADNNYSPPSGFVKRSDQFISSLGVAEGGGASATKVFSATGATGAQTFNSGQVLGTDYAAQTIAIKPGVLVIA